MTLLPHVLFVDDEPRILDGMRRLLRPLHDRWRTSFATSAADALAILEREWVDVIISDVRMPGMNGVALLQQVRHAYPHMVRIVLSGHADERDGLAALGPVHQFLAKPCPANVLRATLDRVEVFGRLLRGPTVRAMITGVETLPTPSEVHQELMAELDRPTVSLRAVGEIVSRDVSLSAKVLQLVNSSFFGIARRVVAPVHAVNLLGTAVVRAVAISQELFTHAAGDGSDVALNQFMAWSLDCASLSREIAHRLGTRGAGLDDVFLAGLLHDVGHLVIASSAPEVASPPSVDPAGGDLESIERTRFGATHGEIGGYLLALWGFDSNVVDTAVYHHAPSRAPHDSIAALTAVHLAQCILPRRNGCALPPALDETYLTSRGLSTDETHWRRIASPAA